MWTYCFFAVLVAVTVVPGKSPIVVIQKFCCHGNVTSQFSTPIETLSNSTQLTELNSVLTSSMWFEPGNPTIRM